MCWISVKGKNLNDFHCYIGDNFIQLDILNPTLHCQLWPVFGAKVLKPTLPVQLLYKLQFDLIV